jgi:hypothetical protein
VAEGTNLVKDEVFTEITGEFFNSFKSNIRGVVEIINNHDAVTAK